MRVLLVFLLVCLPASGDEIYVWNRPFKGAVSGAGAELYVELDKFAAALKLPAEGTWSVGPGGVTVGGTVVPSREEAGARMVHMNAFCQAVGAKVVKNAGLGTLDIYLPTDSAGARDWGAGGTAAVGGPGEAVLRYFGAYKTMMASLDLKNPDNPANAELPKRFLESMKPVVTTSYYSELRKQMQQQPAAGSGTEGSDTALVQGLMGLLAVTIQSFAEASVSIQGERVSGETADVDVQITMKNPFDGKESTQTSTVKCLKENGTWRVSKPPGGGGTAASKPRKFKGQSMWKQDVSKAAIPARPVRGNVGGWEFQLKEAEISTFVGSLKLQGGTFFHEVTIFLTGLEDLAQLEGLTMQAAPGGDGPATSISWEENPKPETLNFQEGCSMRLKFGKLKDGKISGEIYATFPDPHHSFVAGSFTATESASSKMMKDK
ncbi:MAG: hypothetical protein HY319_00990 [Armatimonadetes bacterium]|nr:hypothetical protein [Armatimonadota bacterium]